MKSEIVIQKDIAPEDRKYPWLGYGARHAGDEQVVLFTSPKCGVCVMAIGWETLLGNCSDEWLEEEFLEFKGQVILSND